MISSNVSHKLFYSVRGLDSLVCVVAFYVKERFHSVTSHVFQGLSLVVPPSKIESHLPLLYYIPHQAVVAHFSILPFRLYTHDHITALYQFRVVLSCNTPVMLYFKVSVPLCVPYVCVEELCYALRVPIYETLLHEVSYGSNNFPSIEF